MPGSHGERDWDWSPRVSGRRCDVQAMTARSAYVVMPGRLGSRLRHIVMPGTSEHASAPTLQLRHVVMPGTCGAWARGLGRFSKVVPVVHPRPSCPHARKPRVGRQSGDTRRVASNGLQNRDDDQDEDEDEERVDAWRTGSRAPSRVRHSRARPRRPVSQSSRTWKARSSSPNGVPSIRASTSRRV